MRGNWTWDRTWRVVSLRPGSPLTTTHHARPTRRAAHHVRPALVAAHSRPTLRATHHIRPTLISTHSRPPLRATHHVRPTLIAWVSLITGVALVALIAGITLVTLIARISLVTTGQARIVLISTWRACIALWVGHHARVCLGSASGARIPRGGGCCARVALIPDAAWCACISLGPALHHRHRAWPTLANTGITHAGAGRHRCFLCHYERCGCCARNDRGRKYCFVHSISL